MSSAKDKVWVTPPIEARFKLTKAIWHREIIRFARQHHPFWRCVFDAGCGWTGLLERVWEQDWLHGEQPVLEIGFDISEESVAKCRTRLEGTRRPILYLTGRFESMSVLKGCGFDVIFCWEVFYLLDHTELEQAVTVLRSLLSPDGILVCGTLCHRSVPDAVMDGFYPNIAKKIAPHKPYWRLETDYVRLLERHGFNVEIERIRVSPEEYAAKFEPLAAEMFWFDDDAHRRAFYCDYGKSVWLCTAQEPSHQAVDRPV